MRILAMDSAKSRKPVVSIARKEVIISICVLLFTPGVTSGQSDVCPPKNEGALQKLEAYLGGDAWKEARKEVGISTPPSEIRILADDQDAEICRRLSDLYGNQTKDRFFFEAGPYYYVIYQAREGTRPTAPTPIFILDNNEGQLSVGRSRCPEKDKIILRRFGLGRRAPEPRDIRQCGPGARAGEAVAGDTLTLAEVREMIVGTRIENVAQKLGNYERGALKWVFTEEGTFREYRRSESGTYELSETYAYSIVDEYKGTQAPEDIAGYSEFTDSDGDTHYMTIESIHRGKKRPHLYVGTHGMAGNTESIYLMPPRVLE